MKNIHKFWNTYYVANNMAICISGDLKFEKTVRLIDKYWGDFKPSADIPGFEYKAETPISSPIIKEVFGPESGNVYLAYRFLGRHSKDHNYIQVIDQIIRNRHKSIKEDNVIRDRPMRTGSYIDIMKDYSVHEFYGYPGNRSGSH